MIFSAIQVRDLGVVESPVEEERPKVDGDDVEDPSKLADVVSGHAVTLPKNWKVEGQAVKNASGETVATYPAYYDIVSGEGGTYELRLNDLAMPVLDAEGEGEPFKVEPGEGKVTFALKDVEDKLWYGVKSAAMLADEFLPAGEPKPGTELKDGKPLTVDLDSQENVQFYRLYATDIAPSDNGRSSDFKPKFGRSLSRSMR